MEPESEDETQWVNLTLRRVIVREGVDQQWVFLAEDPVPEGASPRGFPIVIGSNEAMEIRRVLQEERLERPLTHQLTLGVIQGLHGKLKAVEITGLQRNTFFARLVLERQDGSVVRVDSRPSDALAIGLRAGAQICAPDDLLEELRRDEK
ncbi:MAG: bifunctional nuclease family protein [Planctomycetes bacterium]|nr:bifunctional nuclease family protein [Planctomycetota bacterium]